MSLLNFLELNKNKSFSETKFKLRYIKIVYLILEKVNFSLNSYIYIIIISF